MRTRTLTSQATYPPTTASVEPTFSAVVLVTAGALTMAFENETRTLAPGQCCEVAAGTLHSECAGPEGAVGILGTNEASD